MELLNDGYDAFYMARKTRDLKLKARVGAEITS